jgi:hypothetical protein
VPGSSALAVWVRLCGSTPMMTTNDLRTDKMGSATADDMPTFSTARHVPTLARQLPLPVRKVVGDLADTNHLLAGLRLQLPASDTTWPAGPGARNSPGSRSDWFHQIQPDFS